MIHRGARKRQSTNQHESNESRAGNTHDTTQTENKWVDFNKICMYSNSVKASLSKRSTLVDDTHSSLLHNTTYQRAGE